MIESIFEYLTNNQPGDWIFFVLAVTAFVETVFPPFPGDLLFIVLAGWTYSSGMSLVTIALVGIAGCFLASIVLFKLGRYFGRRAVEKWLARKVSHHKIERADNLIDKYGPMILVLGRFLPGIRSLLVLIAGTSKMKYLSAGISVLFGSIIWYTILSIAGEIAGDNFEKAGELMNHFELWMWILLGIITVAALLFKIRRKRSTEE